MIKIKEMNLDIRNDNLKRKKFSCLKCNRHFTTTRGNRICGKCHKLIDKRFYESTAGEMQ